MSFGSTAAYESLYSSFSQYTTVPQAHPADLVNPERQVSRPTSASRSFLSDGAATATAGDSRRSKRGSEAGPGEVSGDGTERSYGTVSVTRRKLLSTVGCRERKREAVREL